MNRQELRTKLGLVAGQLLREKGYVSYPDLFIALGYLDQRDYEDWRFRRVPYLERVIKTNLKRISFIMITVRKNSLNGKLKPSRTAYMSWGKEPKDQLRFSKSGSPPIEQLWTTHFVKQKLGQAEAAGAGDAAKETGDRVHLHPESSTL